MGSYEESQLAEWKMSELVNCFRFLLFLARSDDGYSSKNAYCFFFFEWVLRYFFLLVRYAQWAFRCPSHIWGNINSDQLPCTNPIGLTQSLSVEELMKFLWRIYLSLEASPHFGFTR